VDQRRIGSLEVSVVGLGCNNFGVRLDLKQTTAVVHDALDAGITFFDTADVYGNGKSEEFIGRVLAAGRDQVVIATIFGIELDATRKGASPAYVRRACEDSLKRLRTDWIDLYQLHRPDPETPIADTLGALDELVRAGKVREIGCSYFTAAQLREARKAAGTGAVFVSVQNEYSLVVREPEREVLPECERQGLAFLPYYPLASGVLTGKYRLGRPAPAGTRLATNSDSSQRFLGPNAARAEALAAFAESRGHTLLELAFSWLLRHRVVASVFAGAMSPEQVHANAQAAGWRLTADELARVDAIAPLAPGGAP
jgi:aryl-alcohol dehydrogenase-like predicted oxidoreductase